MGEGGGGGCRFKEFWGEGGLKHNGMDGIVRIMFRPFADGSDGNGLELLIFLLLLVCLENCRSGLIVVCCSFGKSLNMFFPVF